MKPILYKANETTFETYGLGEIDATKALVTRERNGNYTLYIEYPASGRLASVFKNDMRIKSDAGLRTKNQTFYISRILKSSKGIIKIYAKHISHLTEFMAMRNGTLANGTASSALSIWASNTLGGVRFDTWSDITTSNRTSWDIANFKNAREALGGREGSILDVWGGEFEFDNTTIRLHKQLGRKSPIVLEYGRNILSAEDEQDIGATYTSIYPYATYTPDSTGSTDGHSEAITVELPEKYIDSKYVGLYNERRVEIVDFSSSFKEKEVPTAAKLRNLANAYIINNNVGLPKINTKIEYVDLSKAQDHASNQILEEAELCDIVPIYYPPIGITSEDGKLTTIVFDVLRGVNDSVEVGTIGEGIRSAMTSGLTTQVSDIAKSQKQLVDTLPKYLLNAQGNKVWYNRPDNKEHKVGDIWFEKNGLYDRMYIWNGTMWEKRIDTEDVDRVKKEVNRKLEEAKTTTDRAIAEANKRAEEALKKAGTLPDTSKLSDQIKQQILASQDLTQKVSETLNQTDSTVIYNKIYQNISQEFTSKQDGEYLIKRLGQANKDLDDITSKISKQTVEFQKLTESNKLYERIIGTSETDAPDKLSRLVMSSDIFQTEVGKYVTDDNNLIVNSATMDKNTLVGATNSNVRVTLNNGTFTIYAFGLTSYNWTGFSLPIYVKKIYHGETYTLGFKYRIRYYPDSSFAFNIKNHGLNKTLLSSDIGKERPPLHEWQEFQKTFKVEEDFAFGEDANYPFYIYLAKNGWIEFKEPILVRGSNTGPYKPSQFDDAYKSVEATRTQVSQLAGSWSVKNLSSAGDVLNSINLLANGTNRIDGRLTHITGETVIDNAVIKDGMIEKVSANKLTAGTIDAREVNLINLNAKSITSGIFKGLTFEGGILRGNNGNTTIDLNNNVTSYNGRATIEFKSPHNSLEFNSSGRKAFLSPSISTGTQIAAWGLGINDRGELDPNKNFVGLKIFNEPNERSIYLIGDVHIVKDSVSNNATAKSLKELFNHINDNFKRLKEFRDRYNEGSPGFWDVSL